MDETELFKAYMQFKPNSNHGCVVSELLCENVDPGI